MPKPARGQTGITIRVSHSELQRLDRDVALAAGRAGAPIERAPYVKAAALGRGDDLRLRAALTQYLSELRRKVSDGLDAEEAVLVPGEEVVRALDAILEGGR